MSIVQVQELIEAGVHYGHRSSRWNPKMRPYIYGKRNLIHIIDLRETVRSGGSRADLTRQIRAGIWRKPWGHGIAEGDFNIGRGMSQIGG